LTEKTIKERGGGRRRERNLRIIVIFENLFKVLAVKLIVQKEKKLGNERNVPGVI